MVGQILVAQDQGCHLIKMVGDVRLTLAISFDQFIRDMFSSDFHCVTFDLRKACAIDSTTLGLVAKIALRAREFGHRPRTLVQSQSIRRVLEVMGFAELLEVVDTDDDGAFDEKVLDVESLVQLEGDEETVKHHVLEAHKLLMSLNESNQLKFRELVEGLEQGL